MSLVWREIEVLGEDSYDCYRRSDSFDYDEPRDFEEWCAWNDVDEEEGYHQTCTDNIIVDYVAIEK